MSEELKEAGVVADEMRLNELEKTMEELRNQVTESIGYYKDELDAQGFELSEDTDALTDDDMQNLIGAVEDIEYAHNDFMAALGNAVNEYGRCQYELDQLKEKMAAQQDGDGR